MSPRRTEHGTPEGYTRGCTKHEKCPALPVHGLTCETAHIRFESGERRYMNLYGRNMPAAAIARRLGFAPKKPSADAIAPEDEYPIAAAPDVEEAIARYAARKEAQERSAATTKEPTVTLEPTPPVCPECVAGKHPNCDGRAWDDVADAATTCACVDSTHTPEPADEQAHETEEPTMTEPTEPTDSTETPAEDAAAPEIPSQSVIRAWARANGIEVNPRGSVQKGVVNAYLAAHRTLVGSAPDAAKEPVEIEEATPAPDHPAEVVAPATSPEPAESDEPETVVLIRDFARNSDILDETRRRLGMEEHPSSWVLSQEVVPDRTRPEWADVAVSHDVEQARSLAARLEAENAILLEQLTTVSSSLEFALRQWATATDRATAAEHQKIGAQLRALDAEEQRDITNTALAETTVELNDALARVALLESKVAIAQPAATPIRRMFGNVR
ncbi:Lsr2 family DNA-binding protein [Microbacterium arborescens]